MPPRSRSVRRVMTTLFACFATVIAVQNFAVSAKKNTKSEMRITHDLKYLASDELEGRGVGTKGLDLAAEYIRDEFEKAGLNVRAIDGSAYQEFTVSASAKLGKKNSLRLAGSDDQVIPLKMSQQFNVCSFGGTGEFSGEIVFCGYGIDASKEKSKYNDFADVDMKGKVVIVMRRTPRQNDPKGPFAAAHGQLSVHATLLKKVENVVKNGAAAVLLVNDPYTVEQAKKTFQQQISKWEKKLQDEEQALKEANPDDEDKLQNLKERVAHAERGLKAARERAGKDHDRLMSFGHGGKGADRTLPVFHIKQEICQQLLKKSGHPGLKEIEATIDETMKSMSFVINGWNAIGETSVNKTPTPVKNVIGVLDGDGPLAEETIVIGAHYDHVGRGEFGSREPGSTEIHNGADDNASGTAALIELARRFGSRNEKPTRRIVFIAFTAEERGLLGSAHYVKNPIYPLEKTIAMFNMDMIGRLNDDRLTVHGTGTAPRWQPWLESNGKESGFQLSMKASGIGPSDHSSFYRKNIPVLHFFTGLHKDYHKPDDDWDKVNMQGIVRISNLIEDLVDATLEEKKRPEYLATKTSRSNQPRSGSRPYFGSIPDFGSDEVGYAISGVAPGSPADLGGLKGGDAIVKLGPHEIRNLEDFDLALRKFKGGQKVDVVVKRKGEEVKLQVELAKPR